jgi:hypothetical protein
MRKSHILIMILVCVYYFIALFPYTMGLRRFYFGDSAWIYTVNLLLNEGKIPTKDFAFFYGLSILLFDKLWFGIFGWTPWALLYLYIIGIALSIIGVIRIVTSLDIGRLGSFIIVIASPMIVNAGHLLLSPVHILEPVFLIHALVAQLRGRYTTALVLVTLAAFVKPSLAYVFGLLLVLQVILGGLSAPVPPLRQRVLWLLPAAVVALILSLIVISYFGWEPYLWTQVPLNAGKAYADFNFGFFYGIGRELWKPEPWTPAHYFFTIAGAWLVASIVLLIGTVVSLRYWYTSAARLIFTCGILHIIFVFFLFGNQWSWIYYPYLLFIGAAVALDQAVRFGNSIVHYLAIIAGMLISVFLLFVVVFFWASINGVELWLSHQRYVHAGGLYADSDDARVWAKVLELAQTKRVMVLNRTNAAHIFSPPVDGPRVWVLIRAVAAPGEIERIRDQLAAADVIVKPHWHDNDLMSWPEFAPLLQEFQLLHEYALLDIYVRRTQ